MFTTSLFFPAQSEVPELPIHHALAKAGQLLIQLMSSESIEKVQAWVDRLLTLYPEAKVIGLSAEPMIHDGQLYHDGTLLIFSHFAKTQLTCSAQALSHSGRKDTQALIDGLMLQPDSQAMVCFISQTHIDDKARFHALNTFAPGIVVAGGLATETKQGQWVLLGRQLYHQAMVSVALHSESLHVQTGAYTEWNPVGRTFRVTAANGCTVQRIDDIPIRQLYDRYLGNGQSVPLERLSHFPLMKGEVTLQDVYIPLAEQESGLLFNAPLAVGDEVRFCFDHPSITLEQISIGAERLREFQAEQIVIYSCTSRLDFIAGNQELLPLQNQAATHGGYLAGEWWHDGQSQRMLHHSMTYLALREGTPAQTTLSPAYVTKHDEIAPLFSLIRNALDDLDEMNRDLTQKIQDQASLLTASYRVDRRTGLPNRVVLRERLLQMVNGEHLLALKLINFHQINEKYGYQVGDQLLVDLTGHFQDYLTEHLPGLSSLYAIGVGEWATVFSADRDEEEIHRLFSQFVEQLEHVNFEPYGLPEVDYVSVSLCAGFVSRKEFPAEDADDLLLRAIEARRHAFQRNRHFCSATRLRAQDELRQKRLGWLSCVSRAVLDNNVLVYGQPIVHAHSHQLASYECLVRIEDDGEIILPGRFLPIIEGSHLYTRLSRQMIKSTFDIMRDRHEAFSINLSPQDLMSERTLLRLEAAVKSMADPSRVGLEVLENEQIKDYGQMIEVCEHFKRLGVRIIVDDFGSGYSNIDEIIKLEPQVIKLDGSLICNIDQDIKQRKIAQQLVKLCQVLNAQTVAEFVHNQTVCQISEDMGVDYLQGFYLGQPLRLRQRVLV